MNTRAPGPALGAALMLSLGVFVTPAEAQGRPGGCIKYGLGGAIAGHFAGGHRLKGALAGCALGIYQRRQYEREARERARNRNRNAERAPTERRERSTQYETPGRDAGPARTTSPHRANPYEDLGFDFDAGRGGPGEQQAQRRQLPPGRTGEGFEPGGSFLRRPSSEPDRTGSIGRQLPNWD